MRLKRNVLNKITSEFCHGRVELERGSRSLYDGFGAMGMGGRGFEV